MATYEHPYSTEEIKNHISQIVFDGVTYDIHDETAIHDVADLGLGEVIAFKGSVEFYSELPTNARLGDVYHVQYYNEEAKAKDELLDAEYLWTKQNDVEQWEELGPNYNIASSTHKHNVTASGSITTSHDLKIAENAEVTGKTAESVVTDINPTAGKVGITVSGGALTPSDEAVIKTAEATKGKVGITTTVTPESEKVEISTKSGTFVKSYPGVSGDFVTGLTPTSNKFVTGKGADSKKSFVTGLTPETGSFVTSKEEDATAKFINKVTAPTATFYNSKAADTTGNFVTGLTPASSAFVTGVTEAKNQNAYTASVSGHVLSLAPAVVVTATTGNALTGVTPSTAEAVIAVGALSGATAVTSVSTESGDAVTAVGEFNSEAALISVEPSKADAITAIGTFTTGDALTEVAPATGKALTGLGTAVTGSALTEATSDNEFVTGVEVGAALANDIVTGISTSTANVLKTVSISGITAALDGDVVTSVGKTAKVVDITGSAATKNIPIAGTVSGTASVTGETGTPNG